LLGAGAAVGALFAFATLAGAPDQQAAIGPLYAADLVGGSCGSLVSTLLLLPLFGLSATALGLGLGALMLLLLL
jgi:hypothetical protein